MTMKRIVHIAASALLALSLGTTAALAQEDSTPVDPTLENRPFGQWFEGRFQGRGPMARDGGRLALGLLVRTLAEQANLTNAQVIAELSQGQTIADIAAANGLDVNAVVQQALVQFTERLEQAIANGRVSEERVAEWLAAAETRLNEAAQQTPALIQNGQLAERFVVRQVAEAAGLSLRAIQAELLEGVSLSDILTENGVDVSAFIAEIVATMSARIQQAADSGRISQAYADELIAGLEAQIEARLNATRASI
jgi:hypothetical protein